MPVTSTKIRQIRPQRNGSIRFTVEFTDHTGVQSVRRYTTDRFQELGEVPNSDDWDSYVAAATALVETKISADLTSLVNEKLIAREISRAYLDAQRGENVSVRTFDHADRIDALRYIIRHGMRSRMEDGGRWAVTIDSLTNNNLTALGLSSAQITKIRNRANNMAQFSSLKTTDEMAREARL